jgi:flagellar FliL protein
MWKRSAAKAHVAGGAAPASSEVNSVLPLDSFVVNLQDPAGNGYLRVGIDLGLAGAAKDDDKEKQAAYLPRLRDTILGVLGSRSVDDLLTPDGKTKLKTDLLQAINASVPELQCKEVYFTEFLVQH